MSWNGSENRSAAPAPKKTVKAPPSKWRGLVALVVVVLAGGLAAWWFLGRNGAPRRPQQDKVAKPSQIAEVKPAVATNAAETAKEEPAKRNVRMEKGVEVLRAQVSTNQNGTVTERLWLADGTTKKKIRPPKPVFENPSDQLIAMALSAQPGQSMPPLPGLADVDADFAKAMLSPIRIEETDSDEVKDLKAKVMEARAYLVEEVKNGGTVQEALRQYQADMEKCADSHLMAAQQMKEILDSYGEEAANEFRSRVNESFRLRGIPELEAPDDDAQDADREDARADS